MVCKHGTEYECKVCKEERRLKQCAHCDGQSMHIMCDRCRGLGYEPEYLGDGVYCTFDGDGILLDLRGEDATTKIAMEPTVLRALVKYATAFGIYLG
jgi:hypothetical protein